MANNFAEKTAKALGELGASLKSVAKIATTKRGTVKPLAKRGRADKNRKALIVLGNGPSLKQNIENDLEILQNNDTLAVNFAANAQEFTLLKPKFYVLADPHFFNNLSDPNVGRLIGNLNKIDWPMTLFVPSSARMSAELINNRFIRTERFAFVAAEGFRKFEDFAFDHGLGMPRPRNVLVPAIMSGAWMGYDEIYLLGADHSWMKTLSVSDDNRVVTVQPHFYKEDEKEVERIKEVYVGRKLHEVIESFHIAFKAYHTIERWAASRDIEIYNATPGSMIDAFKRRDISKLKNS